MANRDPTGFQRASRLDFHTKVSFGLYFVASWNDNDYKVKHPDKHYTSVEGTRQTSGMCKMFMKTSCLWNGLSSMWNDEPGVFDRKSMNIVFS